MTLALEPLDCDVEAGLEVAFTGKPLKDIATALGCSLRHLQRMMQRDAVFAQSVLQARTWGFQVLADSILTLCDDFKEEDPQWLRVKSDNMKWFLKVMQPAIFGDKVQVQIEHVDLKGALTEARTRVITIVNSTPTTHDAPE